MAKTAAKKYSFRAAGPVRRGFSEYQSGAGIRATAKSAWKRPDPALLAMPKNGRTVQRTPGDIAAAAA